MNNNLSPGDIIYRKKAYAYNHYGIYVGNNKVFHNTPLKGEHFTTLGEFLNGEKLEIQPSTYQEKLKRLENVRAKRNFEGYNLFTHNCEHTITSVSGVFPFSKQLILTALFTIAVAYAMS